MSYTPVTWLNAPSTGTPISAANLQHIETGVKDAHYPPLVTALPGSPIDGQLVYYAPAAFQTGSGPFVYIHPPILARYRSSSTSTYHWECLSGELASMQAPTPDTVSSVTYITPSGGTPPTGITIPNAGDWDIEISVQINSATSGTVCSLYLSYDVGATAAVDADALVVGMVNANQAITATRRYRRNFPVAGQLLTPRARTSNLSNTPNFNYWRIAAYPILIG